MKVEAILDDTVDVRRMLRALLERAGATVGLEATSIDEVLRRLSPSADGVVIVDHQLEGDVSGSEGAALVRAHAPDVKIVLFTALDLAGDADANPDVDAVVRKDRVLELPRIVRRLIGQTTTQNPAKFRRPVRARAACEDDTLASWLATPSPLFGQLPPALEAADVVRQLVLPDAGRTDTLLRFVAASGDLDHGVAHLLALRQLIERDAIFDSGVLDLLIVEVTSNVIASARRAALVDPLTGCGNRRALEGDLVSALGRCERLQQVLTVVYFDLVGLKIINDRHGHHEGDRALTSFARALQTTTRTGDGCYRIGGDEFVAVLPDASTDDVTAFIRRLSIAGPPPFSCGSADTLDAGFDGPRLVQLADIRLLSERYGRFQPGAVEAAARP